MPRKFNKHWTVGKKRLYLITYKNNNNVVFSVVVLSLNETEQKDFLNIFQLFPPPPGEGFVTFYSENCTVSDDPILHDIQLSRAGLD